MSFSASSLSTSSLLNTCSDGRLDLEDIFKMAIFMLEQQFKTVGEDNNITINNNSNSNNNNNTIGNNMNHSFVYELAHELYGLTRLEEIYDLLTEQSCQEWQNIEIQTLSMIADTWLKPLSKTWKMDIM